MTRRSRRPPSTQVPEAPIGSHRQRLAPTRAAVSPVEDFERDSAERNTTFIAYTPLVHQDPLENWRDGDGTASTLGHVPIISLPAYSAAEMVRNPPQRAFFFEGLV